MLRLRRDRNHGFATFGRVKAVSLTLCRWRYLGCETLLATPPEGRARSPSPVDQKNLRRPRAHAVHASSSTS